MTSTRRFQPWVIAAVLLSCTAMADAQETPATGTEQAQAAAPRVNWSTGCSAPSRKDPLSCSIEQRVVLRETGQQLGRVAVQTSGAEPRTPGLLLHMPLGLSMAAGVNVVVDADTPVKLQVQTCDASGCYAAQALEGDLLKAMQRGRELKITFEDLQRKPITVTFTLEGFTDAFNGIK